VAFWKSRCLLKVSVGFHGCTFIRQCQNVEPWVSVGRLCLRVNTGVPITHGKSRSYLLFLYWKLLAEKRGPSKYSVFLVFHFTFINLDKIPWIMSFSKQLCGASWLLSLLFFWLVAKRSGLVVVNTVKAVLFTCPLFSKFLRP